MIMLLDYVLLQEVSEKGAVIRPDKTKAYPDVGKVIAVGKGDSYGYPIHPFPITVKKGDRVYFIRDRAQKIELKTGKFYIVKEREILGVLEEGE